jgi:hypothetical protein
MKMMGGEWSRGDVIGVIVLVLTVIGLPAMWLAVPGIPKMFHWDKADKSKEAKAFTSYVGQVSNESGVGIPNALVIATQDESIGQPIHTDANGQFQIQVSAETKSLRLVVSAEGFTTVKIQANTQRTGPEDITPRAAPVISQEKAKPVSPEPKPIKPRETAPTVPQNDPPAPTINQSIINNAPNFGSQINNVFPTPPRPDPPNVGFQQSPYPPAMNFNAFRGNGPAPLSPDNVFLLKIYVDRAYEDRPLILFAINLSQ